MKAWKDHTKMPTGAVVQMDGGIMGGFSCLSICAQFSRMNIYYLCNEKTPHLQDSVMWMVVQRRSPSEEGNSFWRGVWCWPHSGR